MPKRPVNETAALEEVRAVYAALEQRFSPRPCALSTLCCQFRQTGRIPYLTRGEALLAALGVRAAGKKKPLPERPDGSCPLLHPRTGRCEIYAYRPFGCRTHYCDEAGGPLPRPGVRDLIHRLEAVDAALGGVGGQQLPVALAEATERF